MTPSLDGRIALVAGGGGGIGRGIAQELAAAGAQTYVTGRRKPKPSADGITMLQCDHTSDEQTAGVLDSVGRRAGRLDILVNSVFDAAAFERSIGRPFWELDVSSWDEIVGVGTRTAYAVTTLAIPLMLGAPGLVVNVSSAGAERYFYNVAYGAGKAALDKLTADMARELEDEGVAVVSLWPNVTRTEHVDHVIATGDPEAVARLGRIDRMETPRFHGRAVVHLATDVDRMTLSGRRFWTAALAERYGFTDEHGKNHRAPDW